jgi:hypothetical protein
MVVSFCWEAGPTPDSVGWLQGLDALIAVFAMADAGDLVEA